MTAQPFWTPVPLSESKPRPARMTCEAFFDTEPLRRSIGRTRTTVGQHADSVGLDIPTVRGQLITLFAWGFVPLASTAMRVKVLELTDRGRDSFAWSAPPPTDEEEWAKELPLQVAKRHRVRVHDVLTGRSHAACARLCHALVVVAGWDLGRIRLRYGIADAAERAEGWPAPP